MKSKSENLLKGKKDNSFRKGWPAEQRTRRRIDAEARQKAHDVLSTEEKIAKVIARIGPDKGCKELDRLRLRQHDEEIKANREKKKEQAK